MKPCISVLLAALVLSAAVPTVPLSRAGQAHAARSLLPAGASESGGRFAAPGNPDYPAVIDYSGSRTQTTAARSQDRHAPPDAGQTDPAPAPIEAAERAVLKESLVHEAYSYIGIPYVWGGSTPSGFDCSGFVYYMYHKFGIQQVRTNTVNLYAQGFAVDQPMLREGDLVFFRIAGGVNVDHVGIYIGHGCFISAISSKGIYVQQLENPYWGPRYAGARRIY